MPDKFEKDPNAVLDYKWDWAALTNENGTSDWLGSGETISSKTVTADTGLIVDSSSLTDANTSVTAWLSGGTVGVEYNVVCHITTSDARQDDRTIRIVVVQR